MKIRQTELSPQREPALAGVRMCRKEPASMAGRACRVTAVIDPTLDPACAGHTNSVCRAGHANSVCRAGYAVHSCRDGHAASVSR